MNPAAILALALAGVALLGRRQATAAQQGNGNALTAAQASATGGGSGAYGSTTTSRPFGAIEAPHPSTLAPHYAGVDFNPSMATNTYSNPAVTAWIDAKANGFAASALADVPIVGPVLAMLYNIDVRVGAQQAARAIAQTNAKQTAAKAQALTQLQQGDTAATTAAVQRSISPAATSGGVSTPAYTQQVVRRTTTAERTGSDSSGGVVARPTLSSRNLALLE